MPTQEDAVSILDEIRILGANTQKIGSDHEQINRLITWYSRRLTGSDADESNRNEPENRVALFASIIRAYLSPCRSCKNCRYDCQGKSIYPDAVIEDVYGQLVGISTIVAVTAAAIALIVRMVSRNQRAVDEATSWLKRIVVTWIVLNSLGFIVAYLQPLIAGGNYGG